MTVDVYSTIVGLLFKMARQKLWSSSLIALVSTIAGAAMAIILLIGFLYQSKYVLVLSSLCFCADILSEICVLCKSLFLEQPHFAHFFHAYS